MNENVQQQQIGDSSKENQVDINEDDISKKEGAETDGNNQHFGKDKDIINSGQSSRNSQQHKHAHSIFLTNPQHQRTFYNRKLYVMDHHGSSSANEKRMGFADRRIKSQTQQQVGGKGNSYSSEKPSGRVNQKKTRSLSTNTTGQSQDDMGAQKPRNKQRTGNSACAIRSTSNSTANGESFDDDEMELDEPFTESEGEDAHNRAVQKPFLAIPRGRIRSLSGTIPPIGYSPHWGGPTMCLGCLQFFQLPEMISDFSAHLLSEHKIVVDGLDIIVDLKRYIEHWRQEFAKRTIDEIFPKVVPEEKNSLYGKVDHYFHINESVQEDYALRQRLAMRRLEEALACQQREREDDTFVMQCIFCRYTARGNRAKIIHHLYTIHHLNLGSPDNLVFVTEYIEHLREKVLRNECIYCEKTYSDRNTLMDHMRKKNHKEVNPKNNYYDRFYIINYLELGKRWLDVLAEDFEDTMPTFMDSDEEEEEESWHEWQEDAGEEELSALCLFCDYASEKLEELTKHINEAHKFDLLDHIRQSNMDTYARMKFVNYLRKRRFNTRTLPKEENNFVEIPSKEEWDIEENLIALFGNDHLLWMLESLFLEKEVDNELGEKKEGNSSEIPKEGVVELGNLVDESKKNTVSGVVPEDLPDLTESILANSEMQESLR